MYHIDDSDTVAVEPLRTPAVTLERHFFQDGDPDLGRDATVVTPDFMNQLQNELLNAVVRSGQVPDKQNDHQLTMAIMMLGGIRLWRDDEDYTLPILVWGSDHILYVAVKPSGPKTLVAEGSTLIVGPKDPTIADNLGWDKYWLSLADYLGIGNGLPEPYGENGSALTVIDQANGLLGWRMASVPRNQELVTTSGIFTAPATGFYRSRKKGGGGGGGGGAGGTLNGRYTSYSGGGAGSGYEIVETVFLEKGQQVQCIIGAAGTAGPGASGQSATAGGDGGDTYFGADDQKPAKGGKGGGRGAFTPGVGGGAGRGSDGGLKGQNGQVGWDLWSYGGVGGAGFVYEDVSNGLGGGGVGGDVNDMGTGYAGTDGLPGFILIEW